MFIICDMTKWLLSNSWYLCTRQNQESKRVEQAATKDDNFSKIEAEVSQKLKSENEGNQTWWIKPESFQTSSDLPMQGNTQEYHKEGWRRQDQGGDEPGREV